MEEKIAEAELVAEAETPSVWIGYNIAIKNIHMYTFLKRGRK